MASAQQSQGLVGTETDTGGGLGFQAPLRLRLSVPVSLSLRLSVSRRPSRLTLLSWTLKLGAALETGGVETACGIPAGAYAPLNLGSLAAPQALPSV